MNPCGYDGGGCCCEICSVVGEAKEAIVNACRMAAAAEREACAAVAEGLAGEYPPRPGDAYFGQGWDDAADAIARAIRERK